MSRIPSSSATIYELGNAPLLDSARAGLIRQFSDDDLRADARLFYRRPRPHSYRTATCAISIDDPLAAENEPAGGKVRATPA